MWWAYLLGAAATAALGVAVYNRLKKSDLINRLRYKYGFAAFKAKVTSASTHSVNVGIYNRDGNLIDHDYIYHSDGIGDDIYPGQVLYIQN